jgi:hypothetical protein
MIISYTLSAKNNTIVSIINSPRPFHYALMKNANFGHRSISTQQRTADTVQRTLEQEQVLPVTAGTNNHDLSNRRSVMMNPE